MTANLQAAKGGSILILPGDHIGPEVVAEALKVLDIIEEHTGVHFHRDTDLCGGASLDRHGVAVTEEVLVKAAKADAVFFGSAGGPEWGTRPPNPESGLLSIRQHMQIFANLRPCNFASKSLISRSPIKAGIVENTSFTVIRENCGGAYFGEKIEGTEYSRDAWEYSRSEIERVARVAGALALQHDPPLQVTSADKANVLANSRLWRQVVSEVFQKEFPSVKLQHQLADSLAMLFITQPTRWNGIIVTDNTFGDILSDEAGGLTGSLGLLPSASLAGAPGGELGRNSVGGVKGLYEPVHGSAPDISGKGLANPVAQVLSLALMLRYSFNMFKEAEIIEQAVEKVLDSKDIGGLEIRTGDLGGSADTKEMSEAIQNESLLTRPTVASEYTSGVHFTVASANFSIGRVREPMFARYVGGLKELDDQTILETRPAETLPPNSHMNGDVIDSVLPELSDEDIRILDTICKLAAASEDTPSKALFAAYDQVLEEQGIKSRHDNVLFRWLMRIVRPKAGRNGKKINFLRELRSLLKTHDIVIQDDSEYADPVDSSSPLHVPNKLDKRRVSFDDARYEETWLSNNTQTFQEDSSALQQIRHARSQSHGRPSHHRETITLTPATQPPRLEQQPALVELASIGELEDNAEAFRYTNAIRLARKCLAIWVQAADAILFQQYEHEQIALRHDHKTLVHQVLNNLHGAGREAKEREHEREQERDAGEQLDKADQIISLRKMHKTLEQIRMIAEDSRNHMLKFGHYKRWKALTIHNSLKIESVLLRKFINVWSDKTAEKELNDITAVSHRENSLARSCLTQLLLEVKERDALQQHNVNTTCHALSAWRSSVHKKQGLLRQAEQADLSRLLKYGFRQWRSMRNNTRIQDTAASQLRHERLSRPFLTHLRQSGKVLTILHGVKLEKNQGLQRIIVRTWLVRVNETRRANQHNNTRLQKHTLGSWSDSLRNKIVSERINERLKAEMMYKLMLHERQRLCLRFRDSMLIHQCFEKLWLATGELEVHHEQQLLAFAEGSRRRQLASTTRKWLLAMRQREDAERTAIEFRNARLLPGAWSCVKQKSSHLRELNKWSEDAAFFVATTTTLKRWRVKTTQSQQQRKQQAFEQVRNSVKSRLLSSTWNALRQQGVQISEMSIQAAEYDHHRSINRAAQMLETWRLQHVGLDEFRSAAAEHDKQKLCYSALAALVLSFEQNCVTQDIAIEFRAESNLATMSTLFKKIRFTTFTMTRLEDNAAVFAARAREQAVKQMLRHLAATAAERRRSREQTEEPESPSIRPASRAATRSEPRPGSEARPAMRTVAQLTSTPAYLRTPSRVRRTRYRPIPTPAPFTPFTFTSSYAISTPAPPSVVNSPQAVQDTTTPQVTSFNRKLRAGGIATDVRPTSILRPRSFGRSIGPGTGKSVRFTRGLRLQDRPQDTQ